MKKIIFILTALQSFTFAQSLKTLERGASAITFSINNGGKNLTKNQQADFLIFTAYIRGFTSGVQSMAELSNGYKKESQKVPPPEKWMSSSAKTAASFSAYVTKHKPENYPSRLLTDDFLSKLVMAWYLDSHTKSKPYNKGVALINRNFVFKDILNFLREEEAKLKKSSK